MRLALAVALLALTASTARAQGDPIMPLSEVREGMECTVYSVIRGTEPTTFDAEVLDLVGGEGGPRILVRVSGQAIDETGIGAGFSGSPMYCPGSDGKRKNAGAISETIGDFGGKTVLATPIESILGTTPDPAPEPGSAQPAPAGARSLTAISVRGLTPPVFDALQRAGQRYGRRFIQAAPRLLQQQSAPQGFRPGSAVSVGLSSGDIAIGAVGTVAYVDGDKVWSFGHQFDAVGPRSLFLQGAYVAAVIGNPVQIEGGGTYKLAGATDDRGVATNDTIFAVAGKIGGLPPATPVRIFAADTDSGKEQTTEVQVADETDLGTPAGSSGLSFIAPLAITQAASGLFESTPIRIAGDACIRITIRERSKPIRVCNRYVSDGTGGGIPEGGNLVGLRAGSDLSEILTLIDTYRPAGLHVTEVAARVKVRRGQHQAFMRSVKLPARVRPGQRVTARMKIRRVRGARTETIRFGVRIPSHVKPGKRKVGFRGTDPDSLDDDLFGTLTIELGDEDEEQDLGPQSVKELVAEIRKLDRYDGIRMSLGGRRRAYEHPTLRVGGRASTTVRVVR